MRTQGMRNTRSLSNIIHPSSLLAIAWRTQATGVLGRMTDALRSPAQSQSYATKAYTIGGSAGSIVRGAAADDETFSSKGVTQLI